MQSQAETELFARARALAQLAPVLEAADAPDIGATYLVGGSVRDLVLGRELVDIDLAIEGDALELARALGTPAGVETRFGTLTVIRDGFRYDLARTRAEHYPLPGALPEVEPAGIDADLLRRDFTVNATALALTGPRTGELIAVDGALADLDHDRLAVLHDRSFEDDPTRLFRLARYAARLGFEIAPHTRELAARAIAGGALQTISATRIGNELRLLAAEADPVCAFGAVADVGLPWSLEPRIAAAALTALPGDGRQDILTLACVYATRPFDLDGMGFTAGDREAILQAATEAPVLARRLASTSSRSGIGRAVGNSRIETVALASALGPPSRALTWLNNLRHQRLEITGEDLIRSGIPEGPAIGQALEAAQRAMWDGDAPQRDTQLAVALKAAG